MLLVVFAPLVSQFIAARADRSVGIICSTVKREGSAPAHQVSPDPLSACGYCDLLSHHGFAPSVTPTRIVTRVVVARAQVSAPFALIPYAAFPSGRPRGPPVVS
ncbi:DUF2946 domain-containing protein [Pandoraea terrae]